MPSPRMVMELRATIARLEARVAEADRIASERESALRAVTVELHAWMVGVLADCAYCPSCDAFKPERAGLGHNKDCEATALRERASRALSGSGTDLAGCKARRANMGANDPQDCDWPHCDCDPATNRVMAGLQEAGLEIVRSGGTDLAAKRDAVIRAVGEYAAACHDRMNDGGSECFNGCAACAAHGRMLYAWVALAAPELPTPRALDAHAEGESADG